MFDLVNVKRPTASVIKLVEATGILLGVPVTLVRSRFKVPIPSNYDDTVDYLNGKFYSAMNQLLLLKDEDIPNDVAFALYTKILEPGFDYDLAVQEIGLCGRELFNLVFLILLKLQKDTTRLPIQKNNVMVLVDGSRASYVAMDVAFHAFSHGSCTVLAVSRSSDAGLLRSYLYEDVKRRCEEQFHVPSHCNSLFSAEAESDHDVINLLMEKIEAVSCNLLVLGMNNCNLGLDTNQHIQFWAAWESDVDLMLVKGRAETRPFNALSSHRVFQVNVKKAEYLEDLVKRTKLMMRPDDVIVIVAILDVKGNRADNRRTRHDFGTRSGWVVGPTPPVEDFPESFAEEYEKTFRERMEKCIADCKLEGKVRVGYEDKTKTSVAENLLCIANEESSDVMVFKRELTRDVIVDCAREAPCSIAVLK